MFRRLNHLEFRWNKIAAEKQSILQVSLLLYVTVVMALIVESQRSFALMKAPHGEALSALDAIFDDSVITANVGGVLRQADELPEEDRLDYLSDYVLPNQIHSGFRVSGNFVAAQANASVNAKGELQLNSSEQLQSPVFALLDAAEATGKLPELRIAVADQLAADRRSKSCRYGLLMLIDLELGNNKSVSKSAAALLKLIEADAQPSVTSLWPATLVAFRGVQKFGTNTDVRALVELLNSQKLNKQKRDSHLWFTQVGRLYAESLLQKGARQDHIKWSKPRNWISGERPHLWMDAEASKPLWAINEKQEVHHLSGYRDDACFYRYPLSGDFEVVGDIQSNGRTQFMIAGQGMGLLHGSRQRQGNFRQGFAGIKAKELPNESGPWTQFRMQFKGETARLWLNGKLFHETELPFDENPWFAFSGWWSQRMQFRNVQISPNAQIPNSVQLSSAGHADSWINYDGSNWSFDHLSQEIHGAKRGGAGMLRDSLFRYMRPLQSGESVEYEFFHQPGSSSAAHPSLGRLAFLLRPNGVSTHYITSRCLEQSDIAPENEFADPRHQRGPRRLPLSEGKWNRVKLDFNGGVVTISINGKVAFERPVTASSLPFGLFRYSGSPPSRVRNVELSGNWPSSVGEVQQELTNPIVKDLDQRLPEYPATFTHNFVIDGLPNEIGQFDSGGGRTQVTAKGVSVYRPGVVGRWTGSRLILPFSMQGDFDVQVKFSDLNVKSDYYAAILLDVHFADRKLTWARILRHLKQDEQKKRNSVQTSVSKQHADGQRTYGIASANSCDSLSGRLRIARKGKTLHFLFAEQDSQLFQLYDSQVLSDAPTVPSELILEVLAEGNGSSAVAWKNIRISAEGLTYHGDAGGRPPGSRVCHERGRQWSAKNHNCCGRRRKSGLAGMVSRRTTNCL